MVAVRKHNPLGGMLTVLAVFGLLGVAICTLIPKPQTVSPSSPSELTLAESQAFLSRQETQSLAAQGVQITYDDFSPSSPYFMSLRHGENDGTGIGTESRNVMKGLTAMAGWNRVLHQRGTGNQPQQNGDIFIYSGELDGSMNIAILWVVSQNVAFVVLKAPVAGGGSNQSDLIWQCAWFVSTKLANGHFLPSDADTWFTVGQSWEWWQVTQAAYNLYTPLATITLPPLP